MSLREDISELKRITKENNKMLKNIIQFLNYQSARHDNENMDDFGRNILANLISNSVDGNIRRQ